MTLNEKLAWACRAATSLAILLVAYNQYTTALQAKRAGDIGYSTNAHCANLTSELRDLNRKLDRLQVGSEPLMGAEGEPMGRERIIPATKDTIQEVRDFLAKLDGLVDDVESGRIGAHVEGSLWKGEANISLRRQ